MVDKEPWEKCGKTKSSPTEKAGRGRGGDLLVRSLTPQRELSGESRSRLLNFYLSTQKRIMKN